ncbi:MAG: hypothetical protein ACKOTB_06865, partial [Planctomycetia bacterium]
MSPIMPVTLASNRAAVNRGRSIRAVAWDSVWPLVAVRVVPRVWAAVVAVACSGSLAAERLSVTAGFEGGSVSVLSIDDEAREVRFTPGGDANRGWPCGWYFQIDGLEPGKPVT